MQEHSELVVAPVDEQLWSSYSRRPAISHYVVLQLRLNYLIVFADALAVNRNSADLTIRGSDLLEQVALDARIPLPLKDLIVIVPGRDGLFHSEIVRGRAELDGGCGSDVPVRSLHRGSPFDGPG